MFPRVFRLIFNRFYVWKICATQLDPTYLLNINQGGKRVREQMESRKIQFASKIA